MRFSKRMNNVKKSFIREILKAIETDNMISFAGGLPNPEFFPVKEIEKASVDVLKEDGDNVLQYSTTEGYTPLRKFIVERYYKDMGVTEENIMITNGSQQCFDLIGKVFLDEGDDVVIEKPGYLGAIQAFSVFEANINAVTLNDDGIDLEELENVLKAKNPKLFYAVTNFQNPTGLSYSLEVRKKLAEILKKYDTLMIDDNPYGELKFNDEEIPSMKSLAGHKVIALGSFSKIFAPAMRLGWVCAPKEIIDKMVIVKQASDLHTNYFSQRVLYKYLMTNDLDEHIREIRKAYKEQKDFMLKCLEKECPEGVKITRPEGGMFLWVTLPEGISATELFNITSAKNVAFVPGAPFYTHAKDTNTLRINYTNSSFEEIEKGVKIFAGCIKELIK